MNQLPRERDNLHQTQPNRVTTVLANNKKDTLQANHTLFVKRAIDNMTDERVLNNRHPPINDEETHLSRRQRETPDIVNSYIPTKSD